MSDRVENWSFDVEAQQHLLREALAEAEQTAFRLETMPANRRAMLMISSLIRSKANLINFTTSDSPSSTTTDNCSVSDAEEEKGTIENAEIFADSDREDIIISAHSSSENEHSIELQTRSLAKIHKVGDNILQHNPIQQPHKISIFFHSFLGALNTYTIFLLFTALVVSLALGIKKHGAAISAWINGSILFLTILALVLMKTIRSYFREKSFANKLQTYWLSRGVGLKAHVTRGGVPVIVPSNDIMVGDIVLLKKGSLVPADGIFSDGEFLEIDGEMKSEIINKKNPFLSFGSRVLNGSGSMTVTSVGMNTIWGEMMSKAIVFSVSKSVFESCVNKVNSCIQSTGLLICILINITLFLRNGNGSNVDPKGEPTAVKTTMDGIQGIISKSRFMPMRVLALLSVLLVGITEGLPVILSTAIFIWNHKTLASKVFQKDILSCVNMASINTIICIDEVGGFTDEEYEISGFFIGEELICESSEVASDVLEGLCDGIGTLFGGTKLDPKMMSLISWAEAKIGLREVDVNEQCCGVEMEKKGQGGRNSYLHYKGPPGGILAMCSEYYDKEGKIHSLNDQRRKMFDYIIEHKLAEQEVVAFARKIIIREPGESLNEANHGLVLLGMIGMKCVRSKEIKNSVLTLKEGGIKTIIASRDDVTKLEKIGEMYGLFVPNSNDLMVRADEFRAWTDDEKKEKLANICMIGNCLPSDKIYLIKCLKDQVVAVLAQRTVDAPVLKRANVGLTLGSWSSEVARESSDIHISNGDFNFLVDIIVKGRCFQEIICRDLIPLQLIVGISTSLINFFAAVVCLDTPLSVIQVSWLNLLVAAVESLAAVIEPSNGMLKNTFGQLLANKAIWRNIIIQVSYQITICVALMSKGEALLGGISGASVKSLVFITYSFCILYSMIVNREPEGKNIFKSLFGRSGVYFMAKLVIYLVFQALYCVAEAFISDRELLNWKLLSLCSAIGAGSLVLDLVGKWL